MTGETAPPVVLIVEDEAELCGLYAAFLEDGCTVRTATTGDEALPLIDQDLDVALLDRRLPDWSGEELVSVIHERDIDCGIALVTAVEPSLELTDLPVDEYLSKPIGKEELRRTVDEILFRLVGGADRRELLALISRKIVLEEQFGQASLEKEPEYRKLRRRIALAEERIGISPRPQASKHRPATCPACALRWDVLIDDTVGYLQVASRVWKCRRCGHVENLPDPRDRFVARR